jgi:predicted HNH restriction endonuclease
MFGVAASEALGYEVKPKHFTAGVESFCFRALEEAKFIVVPKNFTADNGLPTVNSGADREWIEGSPKMRKHLRRERSPGLREAKKAEFRRLHKGKLFCESCKEDPVEKYGEHGEACIEVHHDKIQVSEMDAGHKTKLEDLQCLCANCHRYEHRRLKKVLDGSQVPLSGLHA